MQVGRRSTLTVAQNWDAVIGVDQAQDDRGIAPGTADLRNHVRRLRKPALEGIQVVLVDMDKRNSRWNFQTRQLAEGDGAIGHLALLRCYPSPK